MSTDTRDPLTEAIQAVDWDLDMSRTAYQGLEQQVLLRRRRRRAGGLVAVAVLSVGTTVVIASERDETQRHPTVTSSRAWIPPYVQREIRQAGITVARPVGKPAFSKAAALQKTCGDLPLSTCGAPKAYLATEVMDNVTHEGENRLIWFIRWPPAWQPVPSLGAGCDPCYVTRYRRTDAMTGVSYSNFGLDETTHQAPPN